MAEEVDVGGIVATVRIDTEKADSALNSVINALSKFATAIETAIAAVEKVSGKTDTLAAAIDKVGTVSNTATSNVTTLAPAVEQVNKASQSAAQSVGKLNATVSSAAPDKYSAKISKLNSTLETQKQKVAELYAELDKMQEVYVEAEIGMGHDVTDYNPLDNSAFSEIISQIDKEEAKLHELQAQIASVAAERDRAASVAVSASQKQASAANTVSAAVGKQTKEVSASGMVLDTSATALRAVTSAAGGTASKVGYLATELMYLKRSMQAASTAASAMGGVISFVVMAAITLVTSAISSMQEAEEKRQEAFNEGVEGYKKYSEELQTLSQNLSVLNDSSSTTEELVAARNNLTSTFDNMIVGYTEEGEAILATKEQLEEYNQTLVRSAQLKRQETIDNGSQYYDEFENKMRELEKAKRIVEYEKEQLEAAQNESNQNILQYQAQIADLEARLAELNPDNMQDSFQINTIQDKIRQLEGYISEELLIIGNATDAEKAELESLAEGSVKAAEAAVTDIENELLELTSSDLNDWLTAVLRQEIQVIDATTNLVDN